LEAEANDAILWKRKCVGHLHVKRHIKRQMYLSSKELLMRDMMRCVSVASSRGWKGL